MWNYIKLNISSDIRSNSIIISKAISDILELDKEVDNSFDGNKKITSEDIEKEVKFWEFNKTVVYVFK